MSSRTRRGTVESAPKRCAVYTRKSTTAGLEKDFNSLDAQREACAAYIQRHERWVLLEERYDDGGFTGANTDRPAFQRLLADVDADKVDVVVVYKVDRLSRSLLDFAKVVERLNSGGASFVSVTQNFSTADAMGRLTLNMLMSFAEFEREMIAERTRDKIAASRRKGKWTGGVTPLGYALKDKRLEVNDVEAITVREAFALFIQLRQRAMVARTLNERGMLPRAAKRRGERPIAWTKDSIVRLLRNPVYAGMLNSGDELYPGEHAALVDKEMFALVQRMLDGRMPSMRFAGVNFEYVLRGLLRCSICGELMTPSSSSRHGANYRYYRCTTRDRRGVGACPARHVPAPAIERFVADRLSEVRLDQIFGPAVLSAVQTRLQEHRSRLETLRTQLPAKVGLHSATASRLVEELTRLNGRARDIAEASLHAESEKLALAERQLAEVMRNAAALDGVPQSPDAYRAILGDFGVLWRAMSVTARGRLLRALLDHVDVNERTGQVDVYLFELDWRNSDGSGEGSS